VLSASQEVYFAASLASLPKPPMHRHVLSRLTINVKHSNNCIAQERTEKATVITKKRHFYHIKKGTLTMKCRFYFFDIGTT